MILASEVSNARQQPAGIRFLALGGDDRRHHAGLRAIGDHAHQVLNRRPPTAARASSLSCSDKSPARTWVRVGRCCLSWSSRGKRVGVSVKAGVGVPTRRVFLEGLGETIAGFVAKRLRTGLLVVRPARSARGSRTCASGSSRLQVMAGQGVEVELLAHIRILTSAMAPDGQGHLRVGGEVWRSAESGGP